MLGHHYSTSPSALRVTGCSGSYTVFILGCFYFRWRESHLCLRLVWTQKSNPLFSSLSLQHWGPNQTYIKIYIEYTSNVQPCDRSRNDDIRLQEASELQSQTTVFSFLLYFFFPFGCTTDILQCRCGLQYIILQRAVLTSGVTHQISDTFIC